MELMEHKVHQGITEPMELMEHNSPGINGTNGVNGAQVHRDLTEPMELMEHQPSPGNNGTNGVNGAQGSPGQRI